MSNYWKARIPKSIITWSETGQNTKVYFCFRWWKIIISSKENHLPHDKRAKRRKTFPPADSDSGASDDEAAYQKFLKSKGEGKLKLGNSNWNTCHMELCKALEQAGTLDRYGIKHLSLWTDLIENGTLLGCHKEPDWTKYLHVVHVEPLPKRGMGFVHARGKMMYSPIFSFSVRKTGNGRDNSNLPCMPCCCLHCPQQ